MKKNACIGRALETTIQFWSASFSFIARGCSMRRCYCAWSMFALVLVFGPVGWRVLSWERSQPPLVVDENLARAGEVLFKHEWQTNDPLSRGGDGLGPVF